MLVQLMIDDIWEKINIRYEHSSIQQINIQYYWHTGIAVTHISPIYIVCVFKTPWSFNRGGFKGGGGSAAPIQK